MRVLLIGAGGMLGKDIQRDWTSVELIPATFADADIRELSQVRKLVEKSRPDWIVLTAAYTDVDASESHKEEAFETNALGTENVARCAKEIRSRLFYVSTDYVFDGNSSRPFEPTDAIRPLNVYGASKAAGEQAVRDYAAGWLIGRTSWLFGASGSSFPEKILRASESRSELTVVSDQIGSPTFTRDLSAAMLQLIQLEANGIVHITNSGVCSWFEFAQEVLRQAGRTSIQVLPVSTSAFPGPARRPSYSVLSAATLNKYGISMRSWTQAVSDYLQELRQIGKLS